MLPLTPRSWTITATVAAFAVSKRMVKHAQKLKAERGILTISEKQQGSKLSKLLADCAQESLLGFQE